MEETKETNNPLPPPTPLVVCESYCDIGGGGRNINPSQIQVTKETI